MIQKIKKSVVLFARKMNKRVVPFVKRNKKPATIMACTGASFLFVKWWMEDNSKRVSPLTKPDSSESGGGIGTALITGGIIVGICVGGWALVSAYGAKTIGLKALAVVAAAAAAPGSNEKCYDSDGESSS